MSESTDLSLTIFGSYKSNSVGDVAILISLLDLLFSEAQDELTVTLLLLGAGDLDNELEQYPWISAVGMRPLAPVRLSSQSDSTQSALAGAAASTKVRLTLRKLSAHSPRFVHVFRNTVRFMRTMPDDVACRSDGLIIGGGNLLMDLFPNWPIRPFGIARQFHRSGKPVILAGVGAFPLGTWWGKFLLLRLARSSSEIWVRDRETEGFLCDKWQVPAVYHPDFAFSFPLVGADRTWPGGRQEGTIAVNIAPVYGENWPYQDVGRYEQFVASMAEALLNYARRHSNPQFYFFDTNYPTDRPATLDLIDRLTGLGISPGRISYVDRRLSAEEISQNLGDASITLVTRLHAGILALNAGSPLLAIAYQPKVNDVLAGVGLSKSVLDIDEVEILDERIREVERSPENNRLSAEKLKELDGANREVVRTMLASFSVAKAQRAV